MKVIVKKEVPYVNVVFNLGHTTVALGLLGVEEQTELIGVLEEAVHYLREYRGDVP